MMSEFNLISYSSPKLCGNDLPLWNVLVVGPLCTDWGGWQRYVSAYSWHTNHVCFNTPTCTTHWFTVWPADRCYQFCIDSTILHVSSRCGQCHQVQTYYNSVVFFAMVMVCLASKDIFSLSLLPRVDTTKKTSSDFSVEMSSWMKSVEKSSLTTMMILSSLQIRRLEFRNSKQKQLVTLKNLFRSATLGSSQLQQLEEKMRETVHLWEMSVVCSVVHLGILPK